MADDPSAPGFLEAGLHISYMNYGATGEGVTSCLAIAGSANGAERVLREKLPPFFHPLIITARVEVTASDDVLRMIAWIPEPAKETLRKIPSRGGAQYFTEFHYNLS